LNIGAGAGSYEPLSLNVVAVEPSAEMVNQRDLSGPPVVRAVAERLPFRNDSFDATLAILTVHHWPGWREGLREMKRVARERAVILTCDPQHPGFWLVQEYFPEILEIDRLIMPSLNDIERELGPVEIRRVPIPSDCTDGFLGAYWQRPQMYLEPGARGAISTFAKLPVVQRGLDRLSGDLASGKWEQRHSALRAVSELDIGYRLLIASAA
jgi:SAM-dependent methyltransferase